LIPQGNSHGFHRSSMSWRDAYLGLDRHSCLSNSARNLSKDILSRFPLAEHPTPLCSGLS
jgi:hypothetical protein